jgi:hypothetical protein
MLSLGLSILAPRDGIPFNGFLCIAPEASAHHSMLAYDSDIVPTITGQVPITNGEIPKSPVTLARLKAAARQCHSRPAPIM